MLLQYLNNECEKGVLQLLSGYKCLLGHLNMSTAALEQCIMDTFAHQSIENIQRVRRYSSYHNVPRSITNSCKNFNVGVTLAFQQLIAYNHNGKLNYYKCINGNVSSCNDLTCNIKWCGPAILLQRHHNKN